MKPCSVYCKPEEGVHAHLTYAPDLDWFLGKERTILRPSCLRMGTRVRVLSCAPAEAPPCPEDWPWMPILAMVEVF